MEKIDYVEEIKKSANDIDFDEATIRLFNDYADFEKSNAKKFLNIIKKSNRENFLKISPEQVDYMYIGNIDKERAQNMCYMYVNDDKGAYLKYVYLDYGVPDYKNAKLADISDSENFVRQFLNLAYAVGVKCVKGKPKDPKDYHYFIHLTNGEEYCLINKNKDALSYFHTLCHRYLSYNMNIYYKNIVHGKSKNNLDKLINKSEASQKLYMSAKKMFNNFDFLYAVMKSLDSPRKMEIFNTCVEKNESYMNHRCMNNLFNYVDTAVSFDMWGIPEKIVFLQDIAEKREKTALGKELYDKLMSIYSDKETVVNMFVNLDTEIMQQKMLEVLNSGETNKNKIYNKYLGITLECFLAK